MSEELVVVDCTKCALTLADHMSLVSSLLELGRQQPVYTMGYNRLQHEHAYGRKHVRHLQWQVIGADGRLLPPDVHWKPATQDAASRRATVSAYNRA